ncbi:MAG: hypothetical protein HQL48_01305 [Gammaproteobacteria bacterium]|nr:hypothetical protein [Gammaproteobacteria bacterium]
MEEPELEGLLEQLELLLQEESTTAAELIEAHRHRLAPSSKGDLLDKVAHEVGKFEFDEALNQLRQLRDQF